MATTRERLGSINKHSREFLSPASQTIPHALGRPSVLATPHVVAPPGMNAMLRAAPVLISTSADTAPASATYRAITTPKRTATLSAQPWSEPIKLSTTASSSKITSQAKEVLRVLPAGPQTPQQMATHITLPTGSRTQSLSFTMSNLGATSTFRESSSAVKSLREGEPRQKPVPFTQVESLTHKRGNTTLTSTSKAANSLYTGHITRLTLNIPPARQMSTCSWSPGRQPAHLVPMSKCPASPSGRRPTQREQLKHFLQIGNAKHCWCWIHLTIDSKPPMTTEDVQEELKPEPHLPPAALPGSKFRNVVCQRVDSPSLESFALTLTPLGSDFLDLGIQEVYHASNDVTALLPDEFDGDSEWIIDTPTEPSCGSERHIQDERAQYRSSPPKEGRYPKNETFVAAMNTLEDTAPHSSTAIDAGGTVPWTERPIAQAWNTRN
ncbi:uncharacterized protein EI97DRAFT_135273 [Westerdykella ornata]|uniref:Uncharacterized protein n=1 Tax=Westerdykella ornata TaxID=318751 RepID=A0A6A6JD19_WESOR|nr:uncharacterized protein EI97DRAFT_135273 [Westerdykella ornata]KAF2274073.1 hypothetical protein EI97DRAFT_135273 [Westerdykella ornata]